MFLILIREDGIYLPNVEAALSKVKTMQSQLAPFASFMPDVVSRLNFIIKDLEAKNASAALEKLTRVRTMVEQYASMSPRVEPLLTVIDDIKKDLT